MFEWVLFLILAFPFVDSPQVEVQSEESTAVVTQEVSDAAVNSDESGASPQCCGPNPLPPPGGGQ